MTSGIKWISLPRHTIIHILHLVLSEWLREVPLSPKTDFPHHSDSTVSEILTLLTRFFSLFLSSSIGYQIIHSELLVLSQTCFTGCLGEEGIEVMVKATCESLRKTLIHLEYTYLRNSIPSHPKNRKIQ